MTESTNRNGDDESNKPLSVQAQIRKWENKSNQNSTTPKDVNPSAIPVKRLKAKSSWITELSTAKQEQKQEQLQNSVTIPTESLDMIEGYSPNFTELWRKLALAGILYTTRSKLSKYKNITHEPSSSAKKMTMKPKTAKGVYRGHLPTDDLKDVEYDRKKKVATAKFKGDDIHVGFERQSLNYILAQIASKKYTITDIYNDNYTDIDKIRHDDKPYHIVIRDNDNAGKQYVFRLAEFGEPSWKRPTIKERTNRFLLEASPRASKLPLNEMTLDDRFAEISRNELFKSHLDDTVKILRYEGNRKINEDPHLVCDEDGRLTRGDVDLQNTFLPDFIPAGALELITFNMPANELVEALIELKKMLEMGNIAKSLLSKKSVDSGDFTDTLKAQDARSLNIATIVSIAINKLNASIKEDPKKADVIVSELGSINLFNAAMVLALETDILHGADSASPIYPENITATNIQNPDTGAFLHVNQTIGEYQYLRFIHAHDKIMDHKVMDFNPCWFVPAPEYTKDGNPIRWRSDDTKQKGDTQVCDNLKDEAYSIELWRLLFEKQLLIYKRSGSHSEKQYADYITILNTNFDKMINNPISAKIEHLVDTFETGKKIANSIITNIAENYDTDELIAARLKEIKQITTGIDAEVNKTLQDRIDDRRTGKLSP